VRVVVGGWEGGCFDLGELIEEGGHGGAAGAGFRSAGFDVVLDFVGACHGGQIWLVYEERLGRGSSLLAAFN